MSSLRSRYLIGIDLGTTNSVVAYIDTQEDAGAGSPILVFPVPQLVGQGEVRALPALPSFPYQRRIVCRSRERHLG
jgi:molecular chaperone DnaK (HSP70)